MFFRDVTASELRGPILRLKELLFNVRVSLPLLHGGCGCGTGHGAGMVMRFFVGRKTTGHLPLRSSESTTGGEFRPAGGSQCFFFQFRWIPIFEL